MKKSIAALILALGLLAHATANAWFLFIPGGLVDTMADKAQGVEGQHCVSPAASVGDVIRLDNGQQWKVMSLSGTSPRCKGIYPIRARLEYQLPEHVRTAEHTECIPPGAKVGDRIRLAGLGEVTVMRISAVNHQCGGVGTGAATASIQAVVVSTQPASPATAPTIAAPAPTPLQTSASAENPQAKRLRDLGGLLKDGLITQDDYDAKKAEILKAF